jgi:peptide/nickel transport system ATP-binding protein
LLEASLSFLGLGDPLNKSWGTTLFFANSRGVFLTDAWLWWVLPAGLCIALVVVSFAFIGFALEEWSRPALAARPVARPQKPAVAPGRAVSGGSSDVPLLGVHGLVVAYATPGGAARAVDGVNLEVKRGQVLGIVGESGCGKSTLAAALLRLVKPPGRVLQGSVLLEGQDIYSLSQNDLRQVRGAKLAYIPQAAMNALNPVLPVAGQVAEAITLHQHLGGTPARNCAAELLEMVGIPKNRARAYPHEFSGGMRQRAVIAMALANNPALVIADEPTTGLDVITQREILAWA